jgi:two-component system nitrogen regulation response regulator GlnG
LGEKVEPAGESSSPTTILGEKVEPAGESSSLGSTDAGGVSVEETFDLAYGCIRERNDKNLLQAVEREVIERCLKETGGNQVRASKLLGITRATLRKRIDLYEIRY